MSSSSQGMSSSLDALDFATRSRREAECWEQLENDAAKRHRKALDCVIQAAERAVEHTKKNTLLKQEVIDTENELAKAVQAKNS